MVWSDIYIIRNIKVNTYPFTAFAIYKNGNTKILGVYSTYDKAVSVAKMLFEQCIIEYCENNIGHIDFF